MRRASEDAIEAPQINLLLCDPPLTVFAGMANPTPGEAPDGESMPVLPEETDTLPTPTIDFCVGR